MANSKIYLGSTNIESLFQGADDISIYLGENKVYPLEEPSIKWKATYSDSHIETAQCDSSSAIVENEIILINLESVEIGDCVTSIGGSAFNTCMSLTSCTIGSGVTSIGDFAFDCCISLTSITVNAITPPRLLMGAINNTNDCPIYVPCESVEAYKSASGWSTYASRITCLNPPFQGKWLATYTGGTTSSADCDASSAITNGEIALTDLESVEIGDCVDTIGDYALYWCTSLTSVVIPNSVTSIGEQAFDSCGITSINIPDGVTDIRNQTFINCSSLTSCTIGSGVTSIGNNAFYNCSGLTSIDIPNSVTSIGDGAFWHCTSLTSITCLSTTPPTLGMMSFDDTNDCPIYVPSASLTAYQTAWSETLYASRIQAIP